MTDITIQKEVIQESDIDSVKPLSRAYAGITFVSPDGTKWFLTVGDDGTVITTEVTE